MSKIKNNTSGLQAILNAVKELPSADTADYEVYEGSYKVTPSVSSKTLDTANKLMQSDVMIEGIPIIRVSNTSGGTTVFIANEV